MVFHCLHVRSRFAGVLALLAGSAAAFLASAVSAEALTPVRLPLMRPGPSSIVCVSASSPRVELVVAYPWDRAIRRRPQVADAMRRALYRSSALIDSSARSASTGARRRIRVQCDASGRPVVRFVRLGQFSRLAAGASRRVRDDLTGRGIIREGVQVIIYVAGATIDSQGGWGGQLDDDSGSDRNVHNRGSWSIIDDQVPANGTYFAPDWTVMLHELGHAMGAVQSSAPHVERFTHHCSDTFDVMCAEYARMSVDPPRRCRIYTFDCGWDDYFNPSPRPGSYLARKWNIGARYHHFLAPERGPDVAGPTRPGEPRQLSATPTTITLTWESSLDAVGVSTYRIERRAPDDSWVVVGATAELSFIDTQASSELGYAYRVSALDLAGNSSDPVETFAVPQVGDDTDPPSPPAAVRVVSIGSGSAVVAWKASGDDTGVQEYVVRRASDETVLATVSSTARRAYVTGITRGENELLVVARDAAGGEGISIARAYGPGLCCA